MKNKKILSLILIFSIILGGFLPAFNSLSYGESPIEGEELQVLPSNFEERILDPDDLVKIHEDDEELRVIVILKDESIDDILKNKGRKIETSSQIDIQALERNIQVTQNQVINKIEKVGVSVNLKERFTLLLNGFSTDIIYSDISKILAIPEVEDVFIAETYTIPDYTAEEASKGNPDLTGVGKAWELGYKGEGQLVSIIDSGVDVSHKDMKITDINKAKVKSDFQYNAKVPYGYNWAENNNNIKDNPIQNFAHGMHVAGIVAGNGEYYGVAPETQLMGHKIFPNQGIKYAQTDALIKAVEDSVAKGADVVNMSLGTRSGFVNPANPLHSAIQKAINNGLTFAISAGNDAISTYPLPIYSDNPDTAVIGSPGTIKDAITVASFESSKITQYVLDYNSTSGQGSIPFINSNNGVAPHVALGGEEYPMVYCGRGEYSDFPEDLTGKIALIENMDYSFTWPSKHAQDVNAAGIIFYNAPGNDIMDIAVYEPKLKIPIVLISSQDGMTLRGIINRRGKVSFDGETTQIDSPNVGTISEFSSWGPNPDLSFKPNVLAPGGNIWSTVNDDQYTNMSGTSMSSPHVAGAAALISQYLDENKPNIKGQEKTIEIKNRLMSTAGPVTPPDEDIEYSPRQQGAGLINIDKAISTNAIVTSENGVNGIELGSIGNQKTFSFDIKNFGDKTLEFEIEASKIITDGRGELPEEFDNDNFIFPVDKEYNTLMPVEVEGAKLNLGVNEITVAPGEIKTVTATLEVPSTANNNIFTDGFIYLNSKTENQTNLVIPYIGFYGDWDALNIIDPQAGSDDSYYNFTSLCTKFVDIINVREVILVLGAYEDENGRMRIDNENVAFAPQGWHATNYRELIPVVSLLRNAKDFEINILDENKKNVRTYVKEKLIPKSGWTYRAPYYLTSDSWIWDGLLYNTKTGYMEQAPDGQYYIQVKSRPEGIDKWQEVLLPIKVDNEAPKVKITSEKPKPGQKDYKLTWEVEDNLTDIENIVIYSYNKRNIVLDGDVREYTLDADEVGMDTIQVRAYDYAFNWGYDSVTYGEPTTPPTEKIVEPHAPARLEIFPKREIRLEAKFSVPKDENGEQIGTWDKTYYTVLDSTGDVVVTQEFSASGQKNAYIHEKETLPRDGKYEVIFGAVDANGNQYEDNRYIFVDTTPPELVFNNVGQDYTVIVPEEQEEFTLEGVISDNLTGMFLWINGEPVVEEYFDYVKMDPVEFQYTVELNEGVNIVQIQAGDSANNRVYQTITITRSDMQEGPKLYITEPGNYTITNEPTILIKGQVIELDDIEIEGVYINEERIEIDEEGYFEIEVELDEGQNIFVIKAMDVEGNKTIRTVTVKYEVELPQEGLPMENLPSNTVIIGDEAFDIRYLNNNEEAQLKLIDWYSKGKEIYIKLSTNLIVNIKGDEVNIEVLPDELIYYNQNGDITRFYKD